MTATKILNSEIEDKKISSLPTRPTAPTAFGGKGYTASMMKEAFDALPLFLVERYNLLIDDISSQGESSVAGAIPTGLSDSHTLSNLFSDIKSGAMADYLSVMDKSLFAVLTEILTEIEKIKTSLGLE